MKAVARKPGVVCLKFHQCMFGLVSKVDRIPQLKLTQFMTNIPEIVRDFRDVRCHGHHPVHRPILGVEGGEKRSTHAQRYPPPMCEVIIESIAQHLMRRAQ